MFKNKFLSLITLLSITICLFCLPPFAYATPPIPYYEGISAGGIVLKDNDGIVVKSQKFTYNLSQLPSLGVDIEDYSSDFTAEYTFYNPTDSDKQIKVYVPVDTPEYLSDTSNYADKYLYQANGQDLPYKTRFTPSRSYIYQDNFNYIDNLSDTPLSLRNIKPDDNVYIYNYTIFSDSLSAFDKKYVYCNLYSDKTIFFDFYNYDNNLNSNEYYMVLESNNFSVVCLGGELYNTKWKVADSMQSLKDGDYTNATVKLTSVKQTSFIDYLKDNLSYQSDSEFTDKYNIIANIVNYYANTCFDLSLISNLIVKTWHEYTIDIPSGQEVINKITAPLFPSISEATNPFSYDIDFSFVPHNIGLTSSYEIIVNTPFYLLDYADNGFEKTDNGSENGNNCYTLKSDKLNSNMQLSLSSEENPTPINYFSGMIIYIIIYCLIIILCFAIIFFIFKKIAKRKAKKRNNS